MDCMRSGCCGQHSGTATAAVVVVATVFELAEPNYSNLINYKAIIRQDLLESVGLITYWIARVADGDLLLHLHLLLLGHLELMLKLECVAWVLHLLLLLRVLHHVHVGGLEVGVWSAHCARWICPIWRQAGLWTLDLNRNLDELKKAVKCLI